MISPFRTLLMFACIALFGFWVIPTLHVNFVSVAQGPQLTISFTMPDATPHRLEQAATAPLENALSQINGLKKITSTSFYDNGQIILLFDDAANMELKKFEAAAIVRQFYPRLPPSLSYPLVSLSSARSEALDRPLVIYTVTGPDDSFVISQAASAVFRGSLSAIPGVRKLDISGSMDRKVAISLDVSKSQAWGLSATSITHEIVEQLTVALLGTVWTEDDHHLFVTLTHGEASLEAVRNVVLETHGRMLRLADVARVYVQDVQPPAYFRVNGRNAVYMEIYHRDGENTVELAEAISARIAKMSSGLPPEYTVRVTHNEAEFTIKELNKNYQRIGASILILSCLILLTYRNRAAVYIILLSLVVNALSISLLLWFFKVEIHLYTLAAVSISFGLMIDNAIVMFDYYHQTGKRKGFVALLAASGVTVAILLTVFFLPSEDRSAFTDFVVILLLAIATSLLTCYSFLPALYRTAHRATVLRPPWPRINTLRRQATMVRRYSQVIAFLAGNKKAFVLLLILMFGTPIFLLPPKIPGHTWYNSTLGSDVYKKHGKAYVDFWLGGFLRRFMINLNQRSIFRDAERTKLYIAARMPQGHTVEQMNEVMLQAETFLAAFKGIELFTTQIYSGQAGRIEVMFKPDYEYSRYPSDVRSQLIARSFNLSGIEWTLLGAGRGFSTGAEYDLPRFEVTMKGYDFEALEAQVNRFCGKLLKSKRIKKVEIDKSSFSHDASGFEYVFALDARNMNRLKTSSFHVLSQIRRLHNTVDVGKSIALKDNLLYPLMLKNGEQELNLWQLLESVIFLEDGRGIMLRDLGNLTLRPSLASIAKENRSYVRHVSFDYMGGYYFGKNVLEKKIAEMTAELPPGFEVSEFSQEEEEATNNHLMLLPFLLATIFVICAIFFEDLKKATAVMAIVPVSFIGILAMFGVSNFYFDQGGYASFILTAGLTVNAAIFILYDWQRMSARGCATSARLIKAVSNRFRTIFVSILSCCCAMIPYLLDGADEVFWFSMAVGVIGGLCMAMFSVFVALPVFMWNRKS
jgi:multidrug efflux pump subunit AcrB